MLEQLYRLFMSISLLVSLFLNPVILIPAIIIIVILVKRNKEYKSGAYYQVTKLPYSSVRRNIGRYGEYLTYQHLKHMEANGAKFLFNVYIPKGNGETTEIDVLMICNKGIFVFESKNYSGWIFGSESQKNWYQTLPTGKRRSHKEHFYNPVMQNRSHIKHLKSLLGEQFPMQSIIVFSDRCTLKSVKINSNNIRVINRYRVASVVSEIYNQTPSDILNEENIAELYDKLFPFTQVGETLKAQHIANIHNNLNKQPVRQTTTKDTPSIATAQTEATNDTQAMEAEANAVDIETIAEDAQSARVDLPELAPIEVETTETELHKCPKCNGNLILRTAHRGANAGNQFYGCSNYPKCKYIQNIMNKTV